MISSFFLRIRLRFHTLNCNWDIFRNKSITICVFQNCHCFPMNDIHIESLVFVCCAICMCIFESFSIYSPADRCKMPPDALTHLIHQCATCVCIYSSGTVWTYNILFIVAKQVDAISIHCAITISTDCKPFVFQQNQQLEPYV